MNDDRISEVYKGEIWSEEAQARARRRIHWMVSEARGEKVLDVGCSQGIASILLGREGFEVVGIDVQPDRIEYALKELENETDETQARVKFAVGNAANLDFEDDSFDTVLLGEVIEHLAVPGRVLSEVHRVLKPEGRVVLTTPFGLLHHHDHKQTFYPDDLYALLDQHFRVTFATIEDRYFRVVAEKGGGDSDPKVLEGLRAAAFATVNGIQQELHDAKKALNRANQELTKTRGSLAELKNRVEADRRELDQLRREKRSLEENLKSETAEHRRVVARATQAEAHAQRLATELERLRNEYAAVKGALEQTQRDLASKTRKLQSAEASVRRLERLERDNARLKYRVEVRDWKLASLRQRRWWRIGAELGKVRRNPFYVLALPVTVGRTLLKRPQPLPRPQPAEQQAPRLGNTTEREPPASPINVETPAVPIVPRVPIPVVGALTEDLAAQLSTEVQLFKFDIRSWREQLASLRPSYLMVDVPSAIELAESIDIRQVIEEARRLRVETVLWDMEPSPLARDHREAFDVLVGAESPPSEGYSGRLVKRTGWIAPALHNPMEAPRKKAVAEVDLVEQRVDTTSFRTSSELCSLAKEYQVLRLSGTPVPTLMAPLVASGSAVVVSDASVEHGIRVDDEAEADRMVRALLRSEVLRARLTHPNVREVMRNHSLHTDVAAVLGRGAEMFPLIEIMVATKRPNRIEGLMKTLGKQTYPNLGLVLVPHGIDLDRTWLEDLAAAEGVQLREVVPVSESVPLGDVFNIGFSATTADVVAKMDDDDFYGEEYLWDLYDALQFSGADVAGKWAHFVYSEGADSLIYRFKDAEHTFREVVAISTLLMHRRVLEEERFPAMPYGSGSVFLRALGAKGAKVYAADRWNYVYIRDHNGRRNTFPMTDLRLLANSDVVCKGLNLDHVVV